jgi:hypothetical protein
MSLLPRNTLDISNDQGGEQPAPLPDFGMVGRDYFLPFHLVMTTPKSTTQDNPLETSIILPIGRINRLWIEFPKGCAGLAGFQLWRASRQIFPVVGGVWMTGDDFMIPLAFTHVIHTVPFEVIGKSYNTDDTYQHRLMVIMEMSGNESNLPEGFQSFIDTLG